MSSYRPLVRGLPVLALAAAQACAPAASVPESAAPAPSAGAGQNGPGHGALPLTYAARPTGPDITPADLMSRLYVIADDSMMGRQAGHRGNAMATDYIAAEFRRMGLEPAGENGTYFQAIPLVVKGIEPGAALSVDGQALAAWNDFSPLPPSGTFPFGAELRARDTPVVFGGTLGGEMITDAQAAGKFVILLPPVVNGQPNGRWWSGYPRERFPNAAAVAVASTDISPPIIRTYGQGQSAELQAGPDQPSTGPAGMSITRAAAERLLGASPQGMRPGTAGRTVTGGFRFASRPVAAPARNVVAILRGSDPAVNHQYVGISAHNDHEGIASEAVDHDSAVAFNTVMRPQGANDQPRTPTAEQAARIRALRDSLAADGTRMDSIYNGADDDASGTVAVLEIARALARGPAPRRTIVFFLATGEEVGMLGTRWYLQHPVVPLDSTAAGFFVEMIGRPDPQAGGPGRAWLTGYERSTVGRMLRTDGVPLVPDPRPEQNFFERSDNTPFARLGVPAHVISSFNLHGDYHTPGDEADRIDYAHMARVIDASIHATRVLADGPRPTWNPGGRPAPGR